MLVRILLTQLAS